MTNLAAELSWMELERRINAGDLAVLPVGAASKEHGKHLPLNTDQLQVEWFCRQLAEELPLLIWPTLTYGYYPAFKQFPGSTSLEPDTFARLLTEVSDALLANGHQYCVVINSGISTRPAIDELAQANPSVVVLHMYTGSHYLRALQQYCQQVGGGHADEAETSIMMHLYAARVKADLSEDESATRFQPGPLNRLVPGQPNYTPSGAMGNPTLATPEKGRILVEAMLEDMTEQLVTCINRISA